MVWDRMARSPLGLMSGLYITYTYFCDEALLGGFIKANCLSKVEILSYARKCYSISHKQCLLARRALLRTEL